jgi:nucleotidyltransferase/DNA polymerase involved in DNA repair
LHHSGRPGGTRAENAPSGCGTGGSRPRHDPCTLSGGPTGRAPAGYARPEGAALHEILRVFAPTIEPRGYGHAFLDLTGTGRLFGPPEDVAARIRREASERLGLPLSVGVAANKLVSQAAIRAERRTGEPADGRRDHDLLYVPLGNGRSFLAPHPVEVLPELDPRIRERLEDYQLDLIGEIAAIHEDALCAVFGRGGRLLRARARGIDPRPVLSPERQSEFHVAHTLATDTNDLGVLHPLLRALTERLGRRLRARGLAAARLRLEATYADYTATARGVPLYAAMLDTDLWDAARRAFALANTKRLAVRSVALTLDRLMEGEAQLELWDGRADRRSGGQADSETENIGHQIITGIEHDSVYPTARPPVRLSALQHALDYIRDRYGAGALRGGPLTAHRSPLMSHQTPTIFPKVAFSSRTRCASASCVIG